MANENKKVESKNVESKKVESKIEVVQPSQTIADVVKMLGSKNHKDRVDLAKNVVEYFTKKGITKNNKGKTISIEAVHSQIGAICRCIQKNVGPKVWQTFKIIETDTEFKIVPK